MTASFPARSDYQLPAETILSLRAVNGKSISVIMNTDNEETHKLHFQGVLSWYENNPHAYVTVNNLIQSIAVKRISFVSIPASVISIF